MAFHRICSENLVDSPTRKTAHQAPTESNQEKTAITAQDVNGGYQSLEMAT
jgi:hypothetical protein